MGGGGGHGHGGGHGGGGGGGGAAVAGLGALILVGAVGGQLFLSAAKEAYASPRQQEQPQYVYQPAAAAGVTTETHQLIAATASIYDVPAGLLYGIWSTESGRLTGGYGVSGPWTPATQVASSCGNSDDTESCAKRYRELAAICSQTRGGARICDPSMVYTSSAMALGPMQIMPFNIIKVAQDGSTSWVGYAADADGDGTVDPHALPDAMAMAAKILRDRFNSRSEGDLMDRWLAATNAYYGSSQEGYYEGDNKVRHHWLQWCATYGCGN